MIKRIGLILLAVALVNSEEATKQEDGDGSLRLMAKLLNDCSRQEDVTICFKMKAVNFLGRLLRTPDPIPITDYVAIARDSETVPDEINQTESFTSEKELEASLPRSLDKKNEKLDEIMWTMLKNLVSTRTLQFSSGDYFQGRKKGGIGGKKDKGMMMMGMMMMGMMMKMAMGKIALIAGKALIIGKIALVLATIIGLKKLSGGGGGGESHPQVVYATAEHSSGGGGGGGWQRRYASDPHSLAYGTHGEYK